MAGVTQSIKRSAEGPVQVDQGEVDKLMRRFFDQHQPHAFGKAAPEVVQSAVQSVHPRRDFDTASDLLNRASQAFDVLINRCQKLERDVDEVTEQARARSAEHEGMIEHLKRLATGLKAQLDAADQASASLKSRLDAAETRAAMAEQRATGLERTSAQAVGQAAMAEWLSTKLHDKVVSAFGIGSRAHPVLEAVATRAAAE